MKPNLEIQPRENEMTHKSWLYERAGELGITAHALEMRMWRGRHPRPPMRVVNQKVMLVVRPI